MKIKNRTRAILLDATIIGMILSGGTTAFAATFTNSVNQSGGGDWTQKAMSGEVLSVATSGNDYLQRMMGEARLGATFNAVLHNKHYGCRPQ